MATITDRERLREEEELAVGPLLARAKLFRVRGQWDEAIASCTDVLRRFPVSITACSLLGEIYEAQGRLDDAIQWYGMALERDPQSSSDRQGLERVTVLKAKQNPESAPPTPPVNTSNPLFKPVGEKTLEWFDRLFPPGDSRSIARMLYAVSAVIGALLVFSGIAFYLFFQNKSRRDMPDLPPPGSAIGGLPTPATPVVIEPSTHEPPVRPVPTPIQSPSASPAPAVTAGEATPGASSEEAKLAAEINRVVNNAFVVESIHRSGDNRATIELLVPPGETPDKSRELVLRDIAATVRLLGQADNNIAATTVRVAMPSLTNAATPINVFSGDLSVSAVRDIDPAQSAYMDILARFSRLQWEGLLTPNADNGVISNAGNPGNAMNSANGVNAGNVGQTGATNPAPGNNAAGNANRSAQQ